MSIAEKLRNEGMEEGKKEGKKEGQKENSIKVAKKALMLNMDVKQIMEITNLTAEEIDQIKKDLNS